MGKGKKKRKKKTLAAKADRHRCYQLAVQAPEADLEFFIERFRQHRRRDPRSLREDFCGTAYMSALWLAGGPRRSALCIDIDQPTLDWGRDRNFRGELGKRARLRCSDVRSVSRPRTDLACAMNFSFCVFKRRQELAEYFRAVYRGLNDDGIFVSELYGGTEAIVAIEERRSVDDFTFVWEQESFNPITNDTVCHIHFEFEDDSRIDRAFTYDWRLWSLPEVDELLREAGFRRVDIYWEQVDEDGDGTGNYEKTRKEENQEGWLVLIVAVK